MTNEQMKIELLEIAKALIDKGPGFAQEPVVLDEAVKKMGIKGDQREERRLLTVWHDLFIDKDLSWGHNIDNPKRPFYHIPVRD